MRKVRIEELFVSMDKEFSKDVYTESDLEVGQAFRDEKGNSWVVVEVV